MQQARDLGGRDGAELSTISMGSPDDGWAAPSPAITETGDRALVWR